MGAGIAQLCLEAGLETVGREVEAERGEAARGQIAHFLGRKVEKGQLEAAARDAALERLCLVTELAELASWGTRANRGGVRRPRGEAGGVRGARARVRRGAISWI